MQPLNEPQRRVLGVLMEKEMSQPEYYPMTLNAVVAGCNQKQNRNPVMDLDAVAVEAALSALQNHGLVTVKLPGPGARSTRYAHHATEMLSWPKPARAIMTELLLRGPQTPGELKSRCSRFANFADLGVVQEQLEELSRREPPMVAALPREPGQAATRYVHLLYPPDESPSPAVERPATAPTGPSALDAQRSTPGPAPAELETLHARIEALEQRCDQLHDRLTALERAPTTQ